MCRSAFGFISPTYSYFFVALGTYIPTRIFLAYVKKELLVKDCSIFA